MYLVPQLRGDEKVMYLRKSRQDDPLATVEEVLEKHEQMLDEWVALHQADGGPIPEANRFREVVSGETLDSRPEVQKVLRLIESPRIRAVVVKEPSRLSRGDLQDIGYLVKILRYTGTLVMTPVYTYDLRDDRDRDQFERELMRGNEYLEYQKKILADGKLQAVKNGNYIGTVPPYGYKKVAYKEGRKTCHTLEPIPEEADVVKWIFQMYAAGLGAMRICDALDAEHIRAPKGGKWGPETITTMLYNVHYIGKVRWNYRQKSLSVKDGEIRRRRLTADDYLIFEGKHPAIIEQELWDAVHAIKGQIPRKNRSAELRNPLAGLLYCTCGKVMVYKQTRNKGKLIGLPRLQCGDNRCKRHGSAIAAEVFKEVAQVLQECIDDFEVRIGQGADNSAEIHRQTIERLEKRLAALRELELKQWDEKTKGGMPDHIFHQLNGRTVAEIEEVTQALCEAAEATPQHVDIREKVVTFRAALELLQDPDAPVEELNKLLKACIERIEYSRPRPEKLGGRQGNTAPFRLDFTLRI